LLLFTVFYINSANAQVIDEKSRELEIKKHLPVLESLLGSAYTFEYKENQLYINFFKNNSLYKTDRLFLDALDLTSVAYSDEEKGIIVLCLKLPKTKKGCIERVFFKELVMSEKTKKKNSVFSHRILFNLNGNEQNKSEIIKELKTIIKLGHQVY
jgi:hypothetical protein